MGPGWVGSEVFTTFGAFFKKKNTKSQSNLKVGMKINIYLE